MPTFKGGSAAGEDQAVKPRQKRKRLIRRRISGPYDNAPQCQASAAARRRNENFPESFSPPSSLIHRTVMKRQLLALTLALGALLPASSRAEAEVSFQFFYDNLSPL